MNNFMTIDEVIAELTRIKETQHNLPAVSEQPCRVKVISQTLASGTIGAFITKIVVVQEKHSSVPVVTLLAE